MKVKNQAQIHFENTRAAVKEIFSSEKYNEVNRTTHYKVSGIYMIYIDCEDNDTILPIYIGQSKDIQKRYKDHLTELLTLNRLSYDTYKSYFFSKKQSFYEGSFKATKIFKFMVEQNCEINQFRMKILMECEIDLLDQYEEFYLQEFSSSYFGFNQLESFLQAKKLNWNIKRKKENEEINISSFLKAIESDIEKVQHYYDYGFTKFNFEHAMPDNILYILNVVNDKESIKEVECLQKKLINLNENRTPGYSKTIHLRNQTNSSLKIKEEFYKEEEDFTVLLISKIKDLLNTDQLKKSDSEPLGRFFIKHEQGKISTMNFFAHSFTRGLLKEYYNEDVNKLIQVRANSIEANNAYFLEEEKKIEHLVELRKKRYELIFPLKPYGLFPLKSLTCESYPDILRRTQIHIQFDLTNDGVMRSVIPKYTDIIRIVVSNTQEKEQSMYYIDNETTNKITNGISYIEKDFNNMMAVKKQHFSLSSRTNDQIGPTLFIENYDNSFISVSSEYKHGINDYVIKDKNLVKLSDVF